MFGTDGCFHPSRFPPLFFELRLVAQPVFRYSRPICVGTVLNKRFGRPRFVHTQHTHPIHRSL